MQNDVIKILLAEDDDDDALFFRRAISRVPGVAVIAHVKDGDETVHYLAGEGSFADRAKHAFPDVLVLDLKMPNRNGFEVLEWMKGRFPKLKIGVFSSSDEPQEMARAQRLGAHLYQRKTYDPENFGRFLHWLETLARAEQKPDSVL